MVPGRNGPCPCGSGKKFKKCCLVRMETAPSDSKPAIRIKGGAAFDPSVNAYRAIVHSWDNAERKGEPQEWQSPETFASEAAALDFYKTSIRSGLTDMLTNVAEKVPDGGFTHTRLE